MNFEAIFNFFADLSFRQAVWFLPPVFALHVWEEAPQFTTWVNCYASPKFTRADFVRNNTMGMILGAGFCLAVSLLPNPAVVYLFFVLALNQCVMNALFHAGTTAAYGAYSPGLITSLTLYPVLFYYLSRLAYREGLLITRAGIIGLLLAAVIHTLVVAQQLYFVRFAPGKGLSEGETSSE